MFSLNGVAIDTSTMAYTAPAARETFTAPAARITVTAPPARTVFTAPPGREIYAHPAGNVVVQGSGFLVTGPATNMNFDVLAGRIVNTRA
ncbi:hypothetical protein DPQ33_16735 [Oceanidesulfovibrio indonesiensis]|uniref:Uncharacterized protein n=1 Tax=Oceanidesulfovibrio indonesiensis TaxID=54767 RepID=A0A7M3MBI1_9BACT|nr:hypothetical protein [Oceanidesulfovibrio indonesiensis]TVM14870.1 hypothetical protein DPQ33_16735 [Oceanidesulfovibrio indonesiensis]